MNPTIDLPLIMSLRLICINLYLTCLRNDFYFWGWNRRWFVGKIIERFKEDSGIVRRDSDLSRV